MKTFLCAALVAVWLPVPAPAAPLPDPAATFATCTGRLSALMEHQWLTGAPGADRTQLRRAWMEDLLESVTTPEQAPQMLARRIEAKFALAALLSRVSFGGDTAAAGWAARRAELQIGACDSLLPG